jgi:uncharacterized protein
MSRDTLSRVFQAIFASSSLSDHARIVWHAGEPMMLPVSFYETAFQLVKQYNAQHIPVTFVLQTNATHVTQQWCDFINAHQIEVSISLDGPQHIHDAHRRDRNGRGTFTRVIRNIDLLQANGIFPTALMVLTREALVYPDDIWAFFLERGIKSVSFLLEEPLGPVQEIPLNTHEDQENYRAFLQRILVLRETSRYPLFIREVDDLINWINTSEHQVYAQANTPLAVVSFDCDGNMSTLSPELLTLRYPRYPDFLFGNVFQDRLEDILVHPRFQDINAEVQHGVSSCKETCDYFIFCGGGSPVNKLSETGSFATTETVNCRLKIQTTTDVVIDYLQKQNNDL